MKRRQCKKTFAGVVIVLMSTLIFCTQTEAAKSASSKISVKPGTQKQKTLKSPVRRINWTAVSPSNFTPDMSFNDAINILRNTTIPPLNIVVLWKNLEREADIYRESPIGIDGVSGVPLRTHLKLLLMSLSGGSTEKLGYVVRDGVIIVSTESSLPNRLRTRIYDITDLVGAPASGGFMPPGGMPFGFGGMPFGGMLGGMMPFGGAGYTGQGQMPYGNTTR